jgi:hypothetical protein
MYWADRFLAAAHQALVLLFGKLPDDGIEVGFGHSRLLSD